MQVPIYPKLTRLHPCLTTNAFNHVRRWQGTWQPTGKTGKIPALIEQLQPDAPSWRQQQWHIALRALRACQSLAASDHTHDGISQLLFADTYAVPPYLVLRYYEGITLADYLKSSQRTSTYVHDLSYRCLIALKLYQLLDNIHRLGYLHRDVKPSNLLITPSQHVVLLDFGLAQPSTNHNALLDTPPQTTTAGTPAYMSPEQLTGRPLNHQSDYYSLGVLLFELFSGTLPFYATNVPDWAIAHCQSPVPLLPQLPHISPFQQQQLQQLIDGLLAKLPDKRLACLAPVRQTLNGLIESIQ